MKRIIMYLSIIRSLPAIFVYYSLKDKKKIDADMDRNGNKTGALALHKELFSSKVFRRVFFVRVLDESIIKYRLIRWTYEPLESLEISSLQHDIGKGLYTYHGYSTIIFCNKMGENNEYGIIAEMSEEYLYKKIKLLLDKPDILEYYRLQTIKRGKIFSKARMVMAVENYFEKIVEKR